MKNRKNKLTNLLKTGILLFGISMLLWNCEKNEEFSIQDKQSRFSVKSLNSKSIDNNYLVKKVLDKFSKKKIKIKEQLTNYQSREIYNEQYDFTIETDNVKYIQDNLNNKHSYTFFVVQEGSETSNLQNLLLLSNNNGDYDVYFVEYDFTQQELNTLGFEALKNRETYYQPIDFDTSVFNQNEIAQKLLAPQLICLEVTEQVLVLCDEGNLNGNSDCQIKNDGTGYEYIAVTVASECWFSSGGSGSGDTNTDNTNGTRISSSTNNDPNPGGGSSGGTTNNNPIITTPNLPAIEDEEKPCDKIKKYEEDTYIKDQLNIVATIAASNTVNVETGLLLKNNPSGWGGDTVVGTPENPYVSFTLETGATIDVFIHTHFKGLLSTFSPGDLQAYYNVLNGGASANGTNLVFMLITNAGTKYAFSVTDLTKFNTFAQKHLLTTESLNEFGEDEMAGVDIENTNALNPQVNN